MAATNRFLFDTEFGTDSSSFDEAPKQAEREEMVYTKSDVEALKAEAFENGLREGQNQSLQGIETSVAETMSAINTQLAQLASEHDGRMNVIKQDSAHLAFSIASKFAPALIDLTPEAEVQKLIEECLIDLHDEPRIVVRANAEVCDKISKKIDDLTSRSAFQGSIILLPDETKHAGDCRVEWADGGTERRLEDIQQRLEEVINRFIRSNRGENQEFKNDMDQPTADQF
ncbi:FliH/SctL family protein [Sneathiella litorea]|uniref:Uncharacterized protein n=1 Tax=Sneathiella litorea TaxID=2606216 RepID=A0A6L8W636_9PROT|nr:FliH/SctL family protein [Sneathiella litorea]MZR30199.1 hypothetical protein [Sneathiella litorea]